MKMTTATKNMRLHRKAKDLILWLYSIGRWKMYRHLGRLFDAQRQEEVACPYQDRELLEKLRKNGYVLSPSPGLYVLSPQGWIEANKTLKVRKA